MKNIYETTLIMVWRVLIGLMVMAAIFVGVSIHQALNTTVTTNVVSFSGEGKVLAKPDVAVIDFSIVTEAATSKAAQDANSEKSNKVTDFLKKQNIEDKDIKTISYNIYPQYEYPRGGVPRIKGYQVSQTIEVKVRDLDSVSSILDGVVTAGANQIGNLNFEIDEPEKLKAQARELAINDAKDKASTLKNQLGIRLGRIINFSEGVVGYPVPMYESAMLGKGGGVGGGPSVPSGENEITVDVTITYQIK
jgi:hypothetical protein